MILGLAMGILLTITFIVQQWYDRDGLAAPANMDFSKITRANFAFFQITEDGYIYGTDR